MKRAGPSELARLFGALPTLFRVGFASAIAYRSEMLVWILTTNMPLVMMVLFRTVAQEAPIQGFDAARISAYFLATLIVRMLTGAWVVWDMTMDIRSGALAMRLLRPIHPLVGYATDNLAAVPMRAVLALPVCVIALAWLGAGQLTHDPVQWAIVPLSILGAWTITFLVMATIGTLGLFWDSSLSVYDLWLGMSFLLSGYLIPISLFPAKMLAIVKWLPFRYLLSFPVETLLGLTTRAETLQALAVQWAYVALFALIAHLVWRRGVAKFAAFGG